MGLYQTMVFRLAYSYTRSRSDAQDICQEVFLRYFCRRPPFTSEEHRRAWLLRVTVNRCKSHLSSWWVRRTVPLDDRIPMPEPEYQELDEVLRRLPEKDRLVIHLFYYEDCTTREIARMMHCTEGAVRTRLTRARQRLGDLLKGG
ncbi:MAG: sigma-70 family RNA polymerase sigma factor [Oscillospiraceae bacterium]|nr:sigma-70 family RNA polymerase sigma factor [Oscillospiraceae bacterium]